MRQLRSVLTVAIAAVTAASIVAGAVQAGENTDVTGTWKQTRINAADGKPSVRIFKLKQNGDKLSGCVLDRPDVELRFDNGTINNGQVSFTVTRNFGRLKLIMRYSGRVRGDTIQGTETSGTIVDGTQHLVNRNWDAKRAKD